MKPTLAKKPNNYQYQSLLMKFADGAPLSCDQLHFLARHEHTLSSREMDPILKYYLKQYRHPHSQEHSFLAPSHKVDTHYVARLKRRLNILLLNEKSHIELRMKPDDFLQFRALTYTELIFHHGNQLLTGAPFYYGGIPQLIYFQWGNLFGVAKYVVLADEKALKSNVLIYFEDMQDRNLQECVYQYNDKLRDELKHQLHLAPTPHPQQKHDETPQYQSIFKIPTLSLSRQSEKREEE